MGVCVRELMGIFACRADDGGDDRGWFVYDVPPDSLHLLSSITQRRASSYLSSDFCEPYLLENPINRISRSDDSQRRRRAEWKR